MRSGSWPFRQRSSALLLTDTSTRGDNGGVEIRELRAFVAVAEEGGLSAAARRLHMSQSALSQTVQSLERHLGATLLVRTHAGATLTEVGQILLREARSVLEHHDRAAATIARATEADNNAPAVLRVGVPLELPHDLLPAALDLLATAHPDTTVTLRHSASAAQLIALRAGELDIALVRDRPADPFLDAILTVREPMGVVLATRDADELAGPDGVHLHGLAGLRWIGFPRSDAPAWHDQVAATLRGHGIEVGPHEHDDHRPVTPEVKIGAVATGRTFALASPQWALPLPHTVMWNPLIGNPINRSTWAVWAADSRRRDLAVLVDALEATNP